jgi:hypothetical protein
VLLQRGDRVSGISAIFVAAFLLIAQTGAAQPLANAEASPAAPSHQIEVSGCVSHFGPGKPPVLALMQGREEREYRLVGNTGALARASFTPVHIRGIEISPAGRYSEGVVDVIGAKILHPIAAMDPSFRDSSRWRQESNQTYGVRFAVPQEQARIGFSAQPHPLPEPSFPRQDGTETFFHVQFSGIYPRSDLGKIYFSVSVNRNIRNRETCEQFRNEQFRDWVIHRSFGPIHGIKYVGVDSRPVLESIHNVHTFQNGLCYDFAFSFEHFRTWPVAAGCLTPLVTSGQERDSIGIILSHVYFFEPKTPNQVRTEPSAPPKVKSFTVAPGEAGSPLPLLAFSWATEGTDYVRLSFKCSESVSIMYGGDRQPAECGDAFLTYPDFSSNLSPNSSVKLSLTAFQKYDLSTVPVTITLTPFSHGRAFPASAKSLTAEAHGYNPIPGGIVSAPQSIRLILARAGAGGATSYAQGSSVQIKWEDPDPGATRDTCVHLWLVRDGPGGIKSYVLNVGRGCVSPAKAGQLTWTVPHEISGSGFRIYARTSGPGIIAAALSAPFNIAP